MPLPFRVLMVFGFAFGPLLALAFVGFYHFFRLHRSSVAIQASVLFGLIAGTIVNVMLVVQSAIRLGLDESVQREIGGAWQGLNLIHLGLDVSWDIYFAAATICLAVAMRSHPRFGTIWSGITLIIGAGLLVLNLLTFPTPPAAAGSIDLGPVAGLWYLVLAVRVLTSLGWVDQQLAGGDARARGGS